MRFDLDREEAGAWLSASRRYIDALDAAAVTPREPVRVLLSGFGPFDQHNVNATAELIGGLRGPAARLFPQPDDERINRLVGAHPLLASERLRLPTGAVVQLITMVLPTLWDAAPALLLKVAAAVRPQLVVMNGIMGAAGHLAVETGARNRAQLRPDASEALAADPSAPHVLNDHELDRVLPMTVEFAAIERAAQDALATVAGVREDGVPLAELLGEVQLQPAGRPENAFVCNATSYAVLAGLAEQQVPAVFLHWPPQLRGQHLSAARGVLLSIVAAQLQAKGG